MSLLWWDPIRQTASSDPFGYHFRNLVSFWYICLKARLLSFDECFVQQETDFCAWTKELSPWFSWHDWLGGMNRSNLRQTSGEFMQGVFCGDHLRIGFMASCWVIRSAEASGGARPYLHRHQIMKSGSQTCWRFFYHGWIRAGLILRATNRKSWVKFVYLSSSGHFHSVRERRVRIFARLFLRGHIPTHFCLLRLSSFAYLNNFVWSFVCWALSRYPRWGCVQNHSCAIGRVDRRSHHFLILHLSQFHRELSLAWASANPGLLLGHRCFPYRHRQLNVHSWGVARCSPPHSPRLHHFRSAAPWLAWEDAWLICRDLWFDFWTAASGRA